MYHGVIADRLHEVLMTGSIPLARLHQCLHLPVDDLEHCVGLLAALIVAILRYYGRPRHVSLVPGRLVVSWSLLRVRSVLVHAGDLLSILGPEVAPRSGRRRRLVSREPLSVR